MIREILLSIAGAILAGSVTVAVTRSAPAAPSHPSTLAGVSSWEDWAQSDDASADASSSNVDEWVLVIDDLEKGDDSPFIFQMREGVVVWSTKEACDTFRGTPEYARVVERLRARVGLDYRLGESQCRDAAAPAVRTKDVGEH